MEPRAERRRSLRSSAALPDAGASAPAIPRERSPAIARCCDSAATVTWRNRATVEKPGGLGGRTPASREWRPAAARSRPASETHPPPSASCTAAPYHQRSAPREPRGFAPGHFCFAKRKDRPRSAISESEPCVEPLSLPPPARLMLGALAQKRPLEASKVNTRSRIRAPSQRRPIGVRAGSRSRASSWQLARRVPGKKRLDEKAGQRRSGIATRETYWVCGIACCPCRPCSK